MVCKEDVFLWFQNLKAHKRIEAVCTILNMCYPIELRFYGTCIEDIGRKDFYVFRDDEMRANEICEIMKIRNIHEECMRSRLIIMLSLLNTNNSICAREIYKILIDEIKLDQLVASGLLLDHKIAEQYLVLLTLAQHHPAFTFEQQSFLCNLCRNLEHCIKEVNSRTNSEIPESYLPTYFPGIIFQQPHLSEKDVLTAGHSFLYNSPHQSKPQDIHFEAQITSLRAKPPHRKMTIRIRVTWGCNKSTDVHKTPQDLALFHRELIKLFPCEAKNTNQDKCIPPIPVAITAWNKPNLNESIITTVAEYIQQLNSKLPGYILANDYVRNFFLPSNSNRASSRNKPGDHKNSDLPPRNSRLRSLTIYNSQISDNSSGLPENRQKIMQRSSLKKYPVTSNMYVQASPVQSPLSSPYASPDNSTVNSRAPSPWSSAAPNNESSTDKAQVRETFNQWEPAKSNNPKELQEMSVEELEALRIRKDSRVNLGKSYDSKSPLNGIIGCYVPKGIHNKPNSTNPSNSNDSSPICSEYSSPPQSPSPGETCNQSSSLSSSNEENPDKRPSSTALKDGCKIEDSESNAGDIALKRTDDESLNVKSNLNRTSLSVIPLAIPYSTIVTQLPPLQNIKPAYLPIPCRTNAASQHLNPIVFDNHNQYSRVPMASALTFIPGLTRSHQDRVMSSVSAPVSTMPPFPVVTSGCVTSHSASCSVSTHKSNNMTMVTNSALPGNRHLQKSVSQIRDCDISAKSIIQTTESPYVTSYILNSSSQLTAATCPCYTTNNARPSPSPSPSIISPGVTPQPSAVPVSLSYLGMPYLFPHAIPFLPAQTPNGFVPQTGHGQSFSYTLPNVITTLPPELIYPEQNYTVQSPTTQGSHITSPGTQCFSSAYNQPPAADTTAALQKISCYNCGKAGHRGPDCKEPTMDDINKCKFQLNFDPGKAPGHSD